MSLATICARDVTKRFGKTTALDGFNLVAEPGQVVALLGPNGAGKTTFVRAVATLLRLDGENSSWPATTPIGSRPPCAR